MLKYNYNEISTGLLLLGNAYQKAIPYRLFKMLRCESYHVSS